jgi:hypothetical protein
MKTDCTLVSENNDPYPNALVRDMIHTLKEMLDLIMSHRCRFWQGCGGNLKESGPQQQTQACSMAQRMQKHHA